MGYTLFLQQSIGTVSFSHGLNIYNDHLNLSYNLDRNSPFRLCLSQIDCLMKSEPKLETCLQRNGAFGIPRKNGFLAQCGGLLRSACIDRVDEGDESIYNLEKSVNGMGETYYNSRRSIM